MEFVCRKRSLLWELDEEGGAKGLVRTRAYRRVWAEVEEIELRRREFKIVRRREEGLGAAMD